MWATSAQQRPGVPPQMVALNRKIGRQRHSLTERSASREQTVWRTTAMHRGLRKVTVDPSSRRAIVLDGRL